MRKASQEPMKLDIRSSNVVFTSELRQHIERRIGLALNRFEAHIRRVSIVFVDVNGPKGGQSMPHDRAAGGT